MGEGGVFHEDDRVESIEGAIVDMAPIGSRHALSRSSKSSQNRRSGALAAIAAYMKSSSFDVVLDAHFRLWENAQLTSRFKFVAVVSWAGLPSTVWGDCSWQSADNTLRGPLVRLE